MKAKTDKRISVELPDEIAGDFETVRKNLRTSKGGLGALAIEFAVRAVKAGELISLNGKLVPVSSISKAA